MTGKKTGLKSLGKWWVLGALVFLLLVNFNASYIFNLIDGDYSYVIFQLEDIDSNQQIDDMIRHENSRLLSGKKIVIDPGHGYYYDSSSDQWYWQRDLNWGLREDLNNIDIAIKVYELLAQYTDAEIYSTRELNKSAGLGESGLPKWQEGAYQYLKDKCDYDPGSVINLNDDLLIRPYYANYINADIYISIHSNADTDPNTGDPNTGHSAGTGTWRGFYTIYGTAEDGINPDPKDKALADNIHPALAASIAYAMPDRGEAQDIDLSGFTLAVLRETSMPAVLFEIGFHDNYTDAMLLLDEYFQDKVAQGIFNGILAYFQHPLSSMVIALDPGHGGSDPGAVGYDGSGYPDEKDVTLDIALKAKAMLENAGATVVMTRSIDTDVSLSERCTIANNANADIFVSIHCNSGSENAHGTETFYYDSPSISNPEVNTLRYRLATALQQSVVGYLGTYDRGVRADYEYFNYHLYVLENTNMPASLVEVAFISNPEEFNMLSQEYWRNEAARGIYEGILRGYYSAPIPEKDTAIPSVEILWPTDGEIVGGTVSLKLSVWDDTGVSVVRARVDGHPWIEDTTHPYNIKIDTELYSIGNHTLIVEVEDLWGNINSTSISIDIQRNVGLAKHGTIAYGESHAERLIDDIDSLDLYASSTWNTTPYGNFTIVMPRVFNITHIKTHLWDGDDRYYCYQIYASMDNNTWICVVNKTQGQWRGWQIDYVNITAKYIRFVGTYNSKNDWIHVTEIQVFSYGFEFSVTLDINESIVKRVTTDNHNDFMPFIYETSNGTIYLLWMRDFGYYSQIWYLKSFDDGLTWPKYGIITPQTQYKLYNPSIAESKDGSVLVVVYNSTRNGKSSIYCVKSTDGGTTWGPEELIIGDSSYNFRHPRLHRTEYGTFWLLYDCDATGQREIYYAYSTDNGYTWGSNTQISYGSDNDQEPFNQQINENGTLYLWAVWTADDSGYFDIYYKKSETWGDWSLWGKITNDSYEDHNPTVTKMANSTVVVAYESLRKDGTQSEIYITYSSDYGGNWSSTQKAINIMEYGHHINPCLLTTTNGRTLMAWSSNIYGDYDIFVSRNLLGLKKHLPKSELQSPKSGLTIYGTNITFMWDAWDEDGDMILYDLYLSPTPYFTTPFAENISQTYYNVSGLLPGTTYYWTVIPKVIGEGRGQCLSGIWNFYVATGTINHPPNKITNISVVNIHSLRPTITWEKVEDMDGHRVYYSLLVGTSNGSGDILSLDLDTNIYTFDFDLNFGITYYVTLWPYDDYGGLGPKSFSQFELYNTPPTIVLISPLNGSVVSSKSIGLYWDGSDEDGDKVLYTVYFSDNLSNLFAMEYMITENETVIVSELQNATTYYWCVMARDIYNFTAQTPIWQFIINNSAEGMAPVAIINGKSIGVLGERMYFDASKCYDPDGIIVEYLWDFGDNTSAKGYSVSHIYRYTGVYTLTLTIRDNSNLTANTSMDIVIYNPSEFNGTNIPPIADIYIPYETTRFSTGEIIVFSAQKSYDPDGTIVSYQWDFGDGTVANGPVVSHSYKSEGLYNVTLVVIDEAGAKGYDIITIEIYFEGWRWKTFTIDNYILMVYFYHPATIIATTETYNGSWAVIGNVINITAKDVIWQEAYLLVNVSELSIPSGMNTSYIDIGIIANDDNITIMGGNYNSTAGIVNISIPYLNARYCVVSNYNPVPVITSASCSCIINEKTREIEIYLGSELKLTGIMSYDPDGQGYMRDFIWVITDNKSLNNITHGIDLSWQFHEKGEYIIVLWVIDDRGAWNSTFVKVTVKERKTTPPPEIIKEEEKKEKNEDIIFTAGIVILISALVITTILFAYILSIRWKITKSSKTVEETDIDDNVDDTEVDTSIGNNLEDNDNKNQS